MPIATLTNIEKTFGQRVLFDKLNLNIYRGERIGPDRRQRRRERPSLFKALLGELVPDAGSAAVDKSIKVGHLQQDPVFDPDNTVIDEAELAFAELHALSHRLRDLEHEMAGQTGEALEKVLEEISESAARVRPRRRLCLAAQARGDAAGHRAWRRRSGSRM